MAQFDIFINENKRSHASVPYLLDIQSDVLADLGTRLVVPLRLEEKFHEIMIKKLHVPIIIGDISYLAFVSEMAAIPLDKLGPHSGSASSERTELIGAIDFLVTGF
jgi:toxin CcdB